ncbi:hypothetical protein E4U38_000300 [Claviceps purpurea]|nr:hypothetical protein E4U38_000300 [Claviceps purpurea]
MRDAAATDNDSTDSDEFWEGAAVSHLMAHQTDVDASKEQILRGPDAPATQSIPLRPASPNIPLRPVGREQSTATSQDSLGDAFNSQSTASPQGSAAVPSPSIPFSATSQASQADASNESPTAFPAEQPAMRIPSIRSTPIDELGQKESLLAMAFPTLYPHGTGDYVEARLRNVDDRLLDLLQMLLVVGVDLVVGPIDAQRIFKANHI